MKRIILTGILITLLNVPCPAAYLFVPDQYSTIQGAVDAAVDGDTIRVMPGTYTGLVHSTDKSLTLKSELGPNVTILERGAMDPNGSVVHLTGSNVSSSYIKIDGFTISNGTGTIVSDVCEGGGIYCTAQYVEITNNIIIDNHIGISFESNFARGGGIYLVCVDGILANNIISNNSIDDSITSSDGGGLYINSASSSDLQMTNNEISHNTVNSYGQAHGGGLVLQRGDLDISNCTFYNNSGSADGLSNVLYCTDGFLSNADISIENSIVWDDEGNGATAELEYMGFFGVMLDVSGTDWLGGEPSVTVGSSCTLNWGSGMIDADPLFVTGTSGGLYLSQIAAGQGTDSPCLDAGNDLAANVCFTVPTGTFCMSDLHTRTDEVADVGQVDLGYHYRVPPRDPITVYVPAHFSTIQAAIDAVINLDTILVVPGTYLESIDFQGKLIVLQSTEGPEVTTIEPPWDRAVTFSSGEGPATRLSGFTITGGEGGVYCYDSSPMVDNCRITGNHTLSGGGVQIRGGSPNFHDCVIIDNQADAFGGGIHISEGGTPLITGCTVTENQAESGGGLSCHEASPQLFNVEITGNDAFYYDGGGVFCNQANPIMTDVTIAGNTASENGGGLHCFGGSLDLLNTQITGNTAFEDGGGLYGTDVSLDLLNVEISGNTAHNDGGGLNCSGGSSTLANTTIAGNTATVDGGGVYLTNATIPTITNSVIWNNSSSTAEQIYIGSSSNPSTLSISYSDIEDGFFGFLIEPDCYVHWGAPMLDADPLFIAGADSDYCLSSTSAGQTTDSPCIDFGSDLASNICFSTLEGTICLDWMSTRSDGGTDTGLVDIGCHHAARILKVPNRYATIQAAIDAAGAGGYTIIVDSGTYTENIDFLGKAITLKSDQGPLVTTIDGGGTGTVVTFQNGEGRDAVIEGFTITGGVAAGDGGGILCDGASPTITANVVSGNTAAFGGGIYCRSGSSALITGNIVSGNTVTSDGGGLWCLSSSPTITCNTINGNMADDDAAGFYGLNFSGEFINNLVYDNTAADWGGGVGLSQCNCTISNNTIVGNTGDVEGGGLFCYDSTVTVVDCIIWNNSSALGPDIYLGYEAYPSTLNISYSNVEGGQGAVHVDPNNTLNWGAGMIDANPLHVTGPAGDYYLSQTFAGEGANSPCLDSGSGQALNICFENSAGTVCLIDYATRSDGLVDVGAVDMGYHYQAADFSTVDANLSCVPGLGTLPFATTMTVNLTNNYPNQVRRVAGRIDARTGNGNSYSNWKSGWTNLAVYETFVSEWNQTLPNLGSVAGANVFTLTAVDVTPSPYNQPPYLPSGDTDTAGCTVTGVQP